MFKVEIKFDTNKLNDEAIERLSNETEEIYVYEYDVKSDEILR